MKRLWMAALLACTAMVVVDARQGTRPASTAAARFEAAQKKEVVDGDLTAAIALYRKLAEGSDRAVAAKALMRMGQCYEKLGATQAAESRKAYERLVRDFADQKDVADQARVRLAALGVVHRQASTTAATLRRLYDGNGRSEPVLSGDGRYAAFAYLADKALNGSLVIRDLVTGDERVFAPPKEAQQTLIPVPAFSPDGRQLAYSVINYRGTRSEVRVTALDGSTSRVLATFDGALCFVLSWTDDGTRVMAASMKFDGTDAKVVAISSNTGAITMSSPFDWGIQDGETLSPDGGYGLAVEKVDESQVVVVRNLRTGVRTLLTEPGVDSTNPIWTPDGKAVLFLSSRESTPGLWLVRVVEGLVQGAPQLVKPSVGDIKPLRVTHNGTLYYWRHSQGSEWYTARVDQATGKVTERLTPLPGMQNTCGCNWSPDSRSIAYGIDLAKGRGETSVGCTVIAVRSLADGRERVLSPGLSNIRRPKWSPDGRSFLVFGSRDGVYGIYGVTVADGTATLLVPNATNPLTGDNALFGNWAPDGKGFYYWIQEGRGQRLMYRELATGANVERYSAPAAAFLWFIVTSVSRTGDIAVAGNAGSGGTPVVVLPFGGGPPRTIYTGPPSNRIRSTVWSGDGRYVWAIRRAPTPEAPDRQELIRIPAAGGEPEYAGLTVPSAFAAIFPSPDGTRLIVATLPTADELWALDNVLPLGKPKPAK